MQHIRHVLFSMHTCILTSCNVFNYLTVKTTTKTITKVSNKYIINT